MGLLFGGKPEEVPFRRKILRSLVYAAMKVWASAYLRAALATCTPSTRRVLDVSLRTGHDIRDSRAGVQ